MDGLLADLVTAAHLVIVLFVALLPLAVIVGAWRGWAWVRRPGLRLFHLGVMAYIVVNALRGELCFLTHWEAHLRRAAGQVDRDGLDLDRVSFVGRLLREVLFLRVEQPVLDRWYLAFGVLVLLVTVAVPPRRRERRRGRLWGAG